MTNSENETVYIKNYLKKSGLVVAWAGSDCDGCRVSCF